MAIEKLDILSRPGNLLLKIAYLGLVAVASPLVAVGETVLMDVWFFRGSIAHP